MTAVSIPKHMAHGDLVLMTRKEYEAMKHMRKTFLTTKTQKQMVKVKRRR